ncbi:hypothetical protein E2493_08695 [Sphingomonas parva]|uniref:VOC domain-containing protein n=1 Tax=Sphingomonas parva TaxID=2555898 RepID=A0A4Y8ZRQ4_9SPHN|nr:VOC family protein [Sphingomonas parva]TFI58701.1 hypothetical protein E2493_08695 [Sphingomonas parva]
MVSCEPLIRSAAPVLSVADVAAMADHFVERLGFAKSGEAGSPPSWASLQRDGVEIMLIAGDDRPPPADWAAYLWVRDADALHAELAARGADLLGPPQDMVYRCRQFEARLPDGRRIAFGANLP